MKRHDIDNFEKTNTQLEGLHQELSQLVKKSPDNPINKFKLKFINTILISANNVLGKNYIPFQDFIKFDEDELPTNSDVTFVISQYLNCMEKLRADNIQTNFSENWVWIIEDSDESIRTSQPEKIMRRK